MIYFRVGNIFNFSEGKIWKEEDGFILGGLGGGVLTILHAIVISTKPDQPPEGPKGVCMHI